MDFFKDKQSTGPTGCTSL